MSIFYRFFSESIERPVESRYADDLTEVKNKFVSDNFDIAREDISRFVYPFSQLIFTYLDFKMEHNDVVEAWKPIDAQVKLPRLREIIYNGVPYNEQYEKLLKTFDFIEAVTLQGAILARVQGFSKVMPSNMDEAFEQLKRWCPFNLEGICD